MDYLYHVHFSILGYAIPKYGLAFSTNKIMGWFYIIIVVVD